MASGEERKIKQLICTRMKSRSFFYFQINEQLILKITSLCLFCNRSAVPSLLITAICQYKYKQTKTLVTMVAWYREKRQKGKGRSAKAAQPMTEAQPLFCLFVSFCLSMSLACILQSPRLLTRIIQLQVTLQVQQLLLSCHSPNYTCSLPCLCLRVLVTPAHFICDSLKLGSDFTFSFIFCLSSFLLSSQTASSTSDTHRHTRAL